jgi:hypothetical protein
MLPFLSFFHHLTHFSLLLLLLLLLLHQSLVNGES